MDLKFERTEPVVSNRGRKAEDNPFEDIVKSIALKTDAKGKPEALKTRIAVPKDEDIAKVAGSVKNKLKAAGIKSGIACTVYSNVEFAEDNKSFTVTFWTGPKIERKPKDKVETPAETPTV